MEEQRGMCAFQPQLPQQMLGVFLNSTFKKQCGRNLKACDQVLAEAVHEKRNQDSLCLVVTVYER